MEQEYHETRMKFNNNFEFLLTTLGFACGFGSVWRFPYLVFKNGGGAFMIPYLVLLMILAIPIFYLEISVGQMHGVCMPQILERMNPRYKGFGYVGTYLATSISTYYNLLMAYAIYYFFQSFRSPLPWEARLLPGEGWSSAYFYEDVLAISPEITDLGNLQIGLFLCYVLGQFLVYLCIKGGVELSGKIAIYTASLPYFLLIILLIRGLFLEGAGTGIYYLLVPDFKKLFNPSVWVDAANQVIFQMSLGVGGLFAYGSYRRKTDNIAKFCFGIPLVTMMCGVIGAFVVFSYMGHISTLSGTPIDEIPLSGPELTYVLYPATLSKMPYSNIWAVLFFTVMVLLGIDTQFGFMDCIAGNIEDAYHGRLYFRDQLLTGEQVRGVICASISIFGIAYCNQAGLYILELVDTFTTTLPFMGLLLFEVYFFCLNKPRFEEIERTLEANNNPIPKFIKQMLTQVDFILLAGLSVLSIYSQIKHSLELPLIICLIGWTISLTPIYIVIHFYQQAQSKQFSEQEHELKQFG